MAAIPGTFLPSDDDGSGVAREPEPTEPPEETEEERLARIARETRAATVMASAPDVDQPHISGGTEGVKKAIS